MELTESQINEKYAKCYMQCMRSTLLPYEYDWTCLSCGYHVIRRKNELAKIQRKNITSSVD